MSLLPFRHPHEHNRRTDRIQKMRLELASINVAPKDGGRYPSRHAKSWSVLVVEELHQLCTVDRRIELHRGRDGVQPAVITYGRHSAVRASSRSPVEFCLIVRLCLKPNHTTVRGSLMSGAALGHRDHAAVRSHRDHAAVRGSFMPAAIHITFTLAHVSQLPFAATSNPSPFATHSGMPPSVAWPSGQPKIPNVPLGLLISYEGMSWHPESASECSPEPALFQELTESTPEPAPFQELTESAPEPTPFRELTESAPEPAPFQELTESTPEPTPFRELTESAPEPAPFWELTESTPEPAPFQELTESTPEPAPFQELTEPAPVQELTESAPEPTPFRELTESTPEPAPFQELTESTPEPAPFQELTEPAPVQELTESAPEPAPFQELTERPLEPELPDYPPDCIFPNIFFLGGGGGGLYSHDHSGWVEATDSPDPPWPSDLIPLTRHGRRIPLTRPGGLLCHAK